MYIYYLSRCITKRGKETSQILMFTKTAERITEQLKEANAITTEQYKICKFGVQQGLTILLNLITVIILETEIITMQVNLLIIHEYFIATRIIIMKKIEYA